MAGPFLKTATTTSLYYRRTWYTQKRPWIKPLPFESKKVMLTGNGSIYTAAGNIWVPSQYASEIAQTKNLCYGKFIDELGSRAQGWVDIIERDKMARSVGNLVGPMIKAAKHIKHLRFSAAARALGIKKPRGLKKSTKAFGSNWLAYHLGWEQNIKEIGVIVDFFQNGIPAAKITVSRVRNIDSTVVYKPVYYTQVDRYQGRIVVKMGATVTITNPNLFMANQMGFVNPAGVVWERVPFSFVVDWFLNVGQILASMSDFVGLSVTDSYTTTFLTHARHTERTGKPAYGYYFLEDSWKQMEMSRVLGISNPSLTVKQIKTPSLTRAATAIGLLSQFLR